MPSRGDDVFAPGPSAPRDAGKGGSDRCAAPTAEQQQYLHASSDTVNKLHSRATSSSNSKIISIGHRKANVLARTTLSYFRKEGSRAWPIEGNGDDAFPIDPALAATRAAVAANTNTFGFSTLEDDITNQQKSTSGTESRSVNPLSRRCLFEFRLCRRPFGTYRHTQATAVASVSAFSSLITTGNSFQDGFGDGSDSQRHGPLPRANKTQGHDGDWWGWVNVDTALETNTFVRTVLS
ncbi:hypothetical protein KC351_g6240 [Hortaea werneckii]|nr:hypothetical protein KC351_g6240 [Hortaea werneckii]